MKHATHLCALTSLITTAVLGKGLPIAVNGQARVVIALGANPIPAEQTAAKDLGEYLQKVTGGAFPQIAESEVSPGVRAIYVGQTAFAAQHGVAFAMLGREESVLRTVSGNLMLTGGRPRGTLYAVYEFLENVVGVRWYTAWSEKVSHRPTLQVPALDKRIKPYFIYRDAYTYLTDVRMYADHAGWLRWLSHCRATIPYYAGDEELLVSLGAEQTFGGRIGGGHGFAPYLPVDKYFEDHPEYYSMRNGKRVPSNGLDGNHACLRNPDVLRVIIEGVREDIRKDPDALCYTVAVNDGGCQTICDCTECRKIAEQYGATAEPRTDTGLLAWFVNQVADAIKVDYPDKYLRTLVYGPACSLPKGIRFRDNVVVQLCGAASAEWSAVARNLWIWQYTNQNRRGNYVRPYLWTVDGELKSYQKLGTITGMFQENEFVPGNDALPYQFYEMNLWVFFHQCQDPGLDLKTLANDYLDGYYGKAAPALRAYLNLVEVRRALYPYQLCDYTFASKAQHCFARAEDAVKGSPELLARVKDARLQLDLTMMSLRNTLIGAYLRTPRASLDRYPYPRSRLQARALETLHTTKHPLLLTKAPNYEMDEKGNSRVTFPSIPSRVESLVEEMCKGKEHVPLPPQFHDLPPDSVFDWTASMFGINPYGGSSNSTDKMQVDDDAADGTAYVRLSAEELPMPIGIWNNETLTDPEFEKSKLEFLKLDQAGQYVNWPQICRVVNAVDIPGPGYHVYKGPRFPLFPGMYVYLTKSWQFQQQLMSLYHADKPKEIWEVYVSAKFTGPAYPHGKPNEPNAVHIDRVVLVRVGTQAEGRISPKLQNQPQHTP
ncbi:MAG: DUF4838 domain-containing protein [Armatimonadetes bacterium]|nr:DUF4838 domain-containing protein [Armatimonadota bacterium]